MSNSKPAITTAVRVCPAFSLEYEENYVAAMGYGNFVRFGNQARELPQNDMVFGAEVPQELIFQVAIKRYIDNFLRGKDIAIIAYGNHLAGKTFTIFGPGFHYTDSEIYYGMLPKAISYMFSKLEPCKTDLNNVWTPHIKMSMYEVLIYGVRDLFFIGGPVVTNPTVTTTEKGLVTVDVTTKDCYFSMQVMDLIRVGMGNRSVSCDGLYHLGSAVVKLELHRPEIKGGEVVGTLMSQAFFVDFACCEVIHADTREILHYDAKILTALAKTHGGLIQCNDAVPFLDHLSFKLLKDAFSGNIETFICCCVSPRKTDSQKTMLFLTVLEHIYNNNPMRLTVPQTENSSSDEQSASQFNQTQMFTFLLLQAETLFSRLGTNRSLTDEDRESVHRWMELKRELVDTTLNAQNHSQLECIEELTESEEELASSDGRVSEDQPGGNSVLESEEEERDLKVYVQSESDCIDSVEELFESFCITVDSKVNSYETEPDLPPMRGRSSTSCSATRRGGLEQLPVTAPQATWVPDPPLAQDNASVTQTDISLNSSGAAESSELVLPIENIINNTLEVLEHLSSSSDEGSEEEEAGVVASLQEHRLREFRYVREKITQLKSSLDVKIKSHTYSNDDLRSYLIVEEMIETLDRGNEFLNFLRVRKVVPAPQLAHLEVWKMAEGMFQGLLTLPEVKDLLIYYFIKVVDLRESTLELESVISLHEQSVHVFQSKISSLNDTIQTLRTQRAGRSDVDRYRPHANRTPTDTLATADNEGACGGAASTIPQQNLSKLQVSNCEPPPKVVRSQNNKKLIVELNRKKL